MKLSPLDYTKAQTGALPQPLGTCTANVPIIRHTPQLNSCQIYHDQHHHRHQKEAPLMTITNSATPKHQNRADLLLQHWPTHLQLRAAIPLSALQWACERARFLCSSQRCAPPPQVHPQAAITSWGPAQQCQRSRRKCAVAQQHSLLGKRTGSQCVATCAASPQAPDPETSLQVGRFAKCGPTVRPSCRDMASGW